MSDERKDQNLPARPTSSLMGQLVRQRQAGEVAPTQQQGGQVAPQRPGQQAGGLAAGGGPGSAAAPAAPSRSEIDRIDAQEEMSHHPGESAEPQQELGKMSTNQALIREREKLIIDQLRRELDTSRMTQISED